MKLKLLFFMGILSVFYNTVMGQNTAPFFQIPPPNRTECPGYVAANVQFQVSDANTPAPDLIVSASATGPQAVTFTYSQDPTGILRAINVIPVMPYVQGVVTVTLTLSDVGVPLPNMSSTAVFTVNFEDITPPIITSAPLVDLVVDINSGNCDFVVPDYTSLLTATDYCGGVASMQTPAPGTILSNDGTTQLIVLSAVDDYGNVSSESFTVTLDDVTPPTVIIQDIEVSLDGTGNVVITPSQIDNGSTDNCSSIASLAYSLDITSFDCSNTGANTVTLTVTDADGNFATNTATVTVVDDIAPAITCPADIAVSNDAGECGAIVSLGLLVSSDNCGVTATSTTRSDSLLLTDAYPVGTTTITWTVADASGNTSSCTQTVTVSDAEVPNAITQNITVKLDSMGNATISTTDIDNGSNDNCGTIASLSLDITSFTCSSLGANTVVLTVEDAAGNTDTASATVTVVDNLSPVITTSGNEEVNNDSGQCGAMVTVSATAIDNCTNPISTAGVRYFNNVADGLLLTDEYPVGTTTITWTATDGSGNVATTTQTVTVNDNETPVFASAFPDLTVDNDPGVCTYDTAQLPVPSVSDNCLPFDGVVTVTPASLDVSAGPDHTPSIVTWTATDNYGNTVSATQSVLVQDLIAPVMSTKDVTLYFDANGQIVITPDDIDDGSTDNSGLLCLTKYVVPNILYCGDKGDNSVILTGTDLWGNQHYKEATVTAVDNINPTIIAPADVALNTNTGCTWVGSLALPTTADNCSVLSVTNDAPSAFPLGDTAVTWTVTDGSGNTATTTQLVTVSDNENPVAIAKLGYVVTLDSTGNASITALDIDNGSTDNCGLVASLSTVSPNIFTCANVGSNNVTLSVTDESGNTDDTIVTIAVVDNIAPSLDTEDFTAVLSSTGVVTVNATDVVDSSSDACEILSTVVSPNTFTCANLGDNTVTVTVTDNNGNVTTGTATVTVEDNDEPTISVTNITVNTNSGCTWNGTLALPVTADNCSVVSVTSDTVVDYAYPVGETDVIWTVTDAAGNTASATQTVTVNDNENPIAIANDFSVTLDAAGSATITTSQVNNNSSDNCGIDLIEISKSTFTCTNVGSNTVVLTVTDNSGNVSTANAIVTVIDDIIPVINPVSPIAVNTSAGICGANLAVTPVATATDNCTVGTPIGTRSDAKALSAVYPVGRTIITWNATDANGNAAVAVVQTVDVTDNQIPVITTNGNKNVNVDVASCGAIISVTASATDNCTVGTPTGVRNDGRPLASGFPLGTTTITWNVTDVNGNAAIAVEQTVTVTDNIKPVIVANGDKFVNSDAGQCGALVAVSATASDNCTVGSPIGTRSDAQPISAPYPVGSTTITWNVTDANTNTAIPVVQIVKVKDIQIPVINGTVVTVNANTDANACGATVTVTAPTASDNCTVGSPVGTRSDNLALTALYPIGTTTITWNVTDVNGNVALSTTTSVKVKDMTAPTVNTKPITVSLNVSGTVSIVAADVNNGSTDACGIASYSIDRTNFSCSDTGAPKTVTLTVIDIYGNVGTGNALVTVTEPVKPIARPISSITLHLDKDGSVTVLAKDLNNASTDNCAIASYTIGGDSSKFFTCANVGTFTLPFAAIDTSGNISDNVNVSITVQDKIVPVITAIVNIDQTTTTLQCGWTPTVSQVPSATAADNCTVGSPVGTRSDAKALTALYPIGTTIITWKVTDVNGNVGIPTTTTVNVKDVTGPTVTVKNISLVLDHGSISIVPEDVLDIATDACGVDVHSYTLSKDTFTIVDVLASPVTIYLTVKDIYGNATVTPVIVTFPIDPTEAAQVITPNGDGINDTWVVENITNHQNSVVRVFNRWGSLVYSAKNYQNDWDGKLNGSDVTVPDGGSYYYQIDLDGTGNVDSEGWLFISRQ